MDDSRKQLSEEPVLLEMLHAKQGLLRQLWQTKAWRLFPMVLIYTSGVAIMAPITPTLMTNFFASEALGEPIQCEKYATGGAPAACQDAHSSVVVWSSWTAFIANSVLSFILMPMVGEWSDVYGRKPFIALAFMLASLSSVVLLLYIKFGVSLLWVYPANAASSAVSSISVSLAFLADLMSPENRAAAFGIFMASFSMGILIGPMVGYAILAHAPNGMRAAVWTALCCCFTCVLYALVVLPESLGQSHKDKARSVLRNSSSALSGSIRAIGILLRSSLFKKLTVCLMLSGAVSEGMMELFIQYLQMVAGFTPKEQAVVFILFGASAFVIQTIFLRWMLGMCGEKRVLSLGLSATLVQQVVLFFARKPWMGYLAIIMGAFGSVSFPSISSIKSNYASNHEQGAVQGALYGARAMAQGIGPLVFAAVFAAFSKTSSSLPYIPGAPFVLGFILTFIAVAISVSIYNDPTKPPMELVPTDDLDAMEGSLSPASPSIKSLDSSCIATPGTPSAESSTSRE